MTLITFQPSIRFDKCKWQSCSPSQGLQKTCLSHGVCYLDFWRKTEKTKNHQTLASIISPGKKKLKKRNPREPIVWYAEQNPSACRSLKMLSWGENVERKKKKPEKTVFLIFLQKEQFSGHPISYIKDAGTQRRSNEPSMKFFWRSCELIQANKWNFNFFDTFADLVERVRKNTWFWWLSWKIIADKVIELWMLNLMV